MLESRSSPEAGSKSAGKKSAFRARLLSTLVLWGLVAAAIWLSEALLYFFLIEAVVLVSVLEFFRIVDLPQAKRRGLAMVILSGAYLAALFLAGPVSGEMDAARAALIDTGAIVLLFAYAVLAEFRFTPVPGSNVARVTVTLFGFLWIPFFFGFVVKLLFIPGGSGIYCVLFLVVVTKFTDMGAYLVGSMMGRHPFMKRISPKKTWEGIAGAMGFALGSALGAAWLLGEKLSLIGWWDAAILGILLGFSAVVGDLVESVVKRSWQTKDSGNVLPGIGGTLDLIDSICFGAPVLWFYLRVMS